MQCTAIQFHSQTNCRLFYDITTFQHGSGINSDIPNLQWFIKPPIYCFTHIFKIGIVFPTIKVLKIGTYILHSNRTSMKLNLLIKANNITLHVQLDFSEFPPKKFFRVLFINIWYGNILNLCLLAQDLPSSELLDIKRINNNSMYWPVPNKISWLKRVLLNPF